MKASPLICRLPTASPLPRSRHFKRTRGPEAVPWLHQTVDSPALMMIAHEKKPTEQAHGPSLKQARVFACFKSKPVTASAVNGRSSGSFNDSVFPVTPPAPPLPGRESAGGFPSQGWSCPRFPPVKRLFSFFH